MIIFPRSLPATEVMCYWSSVLEVVCAVLIRNHRVLVCQRAPGKHLAGSWEFPGGKQEEGESLAECLVREIREELAIEIEVGDKFTSVDQGYTHFSITLHALAARYLSGEPQTVGCADWAWILPEQLDDYALPRADRLIVDYMRRGGLQWGLFDAGEDCGKE